MLRRAIFALSMVLGLGLATPPAGQSQSSLDLNSTMVASCLGGNCSTVQFTLDVAGTAFVDIVRVFSTNAALWQFGSVLGIYDSSLNDVTSSFQSSVTQGGVQLSTWGGGLFWSEPLRIVTQMTAWSSPSQFTAMVYDANGRTDPANPGTFFSTSGTVTPEPSTFLLLGTGLIGLFGMARKRKEDGSGEDVAA